MLQSTLCRLLQSLAVACLGCSALACATTDTPAIVKEEPELVASTTQGGRGYPDGATEAAKPFSILLRPAASPDYGFKESSPVLVGSLPGSGPQKERHYLNSLLGPEGRAISYERRGSCCHFESKNSDLGVGLLDVYEVTWEGAPKPVRLYINMYDPGEPLVPQGLTARH